MRRLCCHGNKDQPQYATHEHIFGKLSKFNIICLKEMLYPVYQSSAILFDFLHGIQTLSVF